MKTYKHFIKEAKKYGEGTRQPRNWVARYHLDSGEKHEIGFTARDKRDATRRARSRIEYMPWKKSVIKITTRRQ